MSHFVASMIPFAPGINQLAAGAAAALLTAIWQGSLLVLLVALCLRLMPAVSAAVRSTIWLSSFAIVFLLHFVPATRQAVGPSHAMHAAPVWSLGLAVVWFTLSLYRAAQLAWSVLRIQQAVRRAEPVLAPLAGPATSRRYTICTSSDVDRPSVLGFWNPRILLPAGLLETLSPAELHQVLLHETEHLRRSDDWTNLLQKVALVVFPLNPALFWIERRLCLERELACDDRVLADTGARKAYATCLAQLAEHAMLRRGLMLALGAWGRQSELAARVHRILRRPEQILNPAKMRFAAASLLLGVLAASITLARSPRLISFAPLAATETVASNAVASNIGTPIPAANAVWTPAVQRVSVSAPAMVTPHSLRRVKPHRPRPVPQFVSAGLRQKNRLPAIGVTLTSADEAPTPVQHFYVPAVTYVPAAYAAVRTPDGWIIFQL